MSNEGAEHITHRTTTSAFLLVGSRLTARLIDFCSLLVLARWLTPADFGIVAIALTLVQMLETVFDVPIAQVFVRSSQVHPAMLDTAFVLGLLRSLALIGLLAACAWPFAMIYRDHRLIPLILFLSLAPAFRGLMSPAMAMYARHIDFRRDVVTEVSGKIIGFAATVIMVICWRNYWAIAAGTVLTPFTMMIASYVMAPYRPRLSLVYWKMYSGFLGWFTLSQLIAATNWKLSRLVLGVYVPHNVLGAFSMAGDLCAIPEQALIRPTIRPLASGLARLQGDVERLCRAYRRSVASIVLIGVPPLLGLAMLARPAIRLAMGPQWQSTPPIVTWLALLACLSLLTAPFNSLCVALGETRRIFTNSLIDLSVRLPSTIALTQYFGLPGTIAAQFAAVLAYTLVVHRSVHRMTGLTPLAQWALQWRTGAAALAMGALLHLLCPLTETVSGLLLLCATGLIALAGMAAYLVTALGLWALCGRPEGAETMIGSAAGRITRALRAYRSAA